MKKVLVFLFIFATIILTSCGRDAQGATAQSGDLSAEQKAFVPTGYPMTVTNVFKITETPSKVIFVSGIIGNNTTMYYSKVDGDFYPFCFDPLCDHKNFTGTEYRTKCIGTMIKDPNRAGINARNVIYLNSRLYFVFYDKIYSCSDAASDLRVEASFSDKMGYYDSLIEHNKALRSGVEVGSPQISFFTPIQAFENAGNLLLFVRVDEDGSITQYAYDTISRKIDNISSKIVKKEKELGLSIYACMFEDGKFYTAAYKNVENANVAGGFNISVIGDFCGYYVSDYDFNNFEPVDSINLNNYVTKVADGYFKYEKKENDGFVYDFVVEKKDGTKEYLCKNVCFDMKPRHIYNNDSSFYFYYWTDVEIGKSGSGTKNCYGGKVYKLDYASGTISVVFDDISFDYCMLPYINEKEKTGLMISTVYTIGKYSITSRGGQFYKFKLNDNGEFVNIEKVNFEGPDI